VHIHCMILSRHMAEGFFS